MSVKTVTRPEARWTRRKDDRPAELLSAALSLFVEKGYTATRLDDIARQAGVSKGTLYLYYASKEDLFKAVVRTGLVPTLERGERLVEEHTGAMADLLEQVLFGWWGAVGDNPLGGISKLMFSESQNFPDLARFYHAEVISRGHRLVQRILERGIANGEFVGLDPELGTRLVLAPLVHLLLWRHSFDVCDVHRLDPERYLRQHLEMILNGLRPRVTKTKPAARVRHREVKVS